MTTPDHNGLNGNGKARKLDTDPEWQSILASFGGKIETSPWPEQPMLPPKPEPMYKVERWKDTGFWAVVKETTGEKKEGVSHVLDLSEGSSKLIPINEEPNHQIVHLFRLGKAQRTTH